ncbi:MULTISPECIES: hypothetical protein [Streptomyces]|uniref:hypothetical protein n=1 Tax=Streptomyces TaxID=1883 RepID=UPI00117F4DD8|nr:hypothetical protein [Streptomyces kasugaensis]
MGLVAPRTATGPGAGRHRSRPPPRQRQRQRQRAAAASSGSGSGSGSEQEYTPDEPPRALTALATSLDDRTAVVAGGPCFVFPERLAAHTPAPPPSSYRTPKGGARRSA